MVADGRFIAWLGQLQYVYRLPSSLLDSQVVGPLDGQLASDPLLSIEKFAIGGARTVRVYRENQLVRDNGVVASVGSKGDSYDNAMIESFNGLYKSELIYRQGPWQGLDDVEFATLDYVDWFNHRRRHGEITDSPRYTTPAAHETNHYNQQLSGHQAETQTTESP